MKDWDIVAVIIFMGLLCIPVIGIPLAFIFSYVYCNYIDRK